MLDPQPAQWYETNGSIKSFFCCLKIMTSQMIPVWHQSGDSGGFPRSPSRPLWRRRRTRRGSCTGQTRGVGWLGWWKYLPVWSIWFIFIPLIESGGKSESDSESCQPHRVSRNWISSPSVERKTDSCCSWVNFYFQRKSDLDHPVFELEAKYDIHTSHCTRKSKSTRLV